MAASEYATVAHLTASGDDRLLRNLSSDTGADGTVNSSNDILRNAIRKASGEVEAHARRGGRYTPTDLAALLAAEDWSLIGLVCDLAIYSLFLRRSGGMPDAIEERYKRAVTMLEALRDGGLVFNMSDNAAAAGLPDLTVSSQAVRGQLRLVSDMDFFPRRSTLEAL